MTPPPSDDSLVSSLDSQLTSDINDNEIHTNQGIAANSRHKMAQLDKKERKFARRKGRRKRKIEVRCNCLAYNAREQFKTFQRRSCK
jgi:hypothetical protein